MTARMVLFFFAMLLVACSDSASYRQGQAMADRTYGSMSMEQMQAQANTILRTVKAELETAEDKRDWWDGFCDRGEEIWLDRLDQINSAMGITVYKPQTIKSMFNQCGGY